MLLALNWHERNTFLTAEEMILQHRNIRAVKNSAMYLHNTFASPRGYSVQVTVADRGKMRPRCYKHNNRTARMLVNHVLSASVIS